ncbi:iron sulfur cluster assembly protein 1, partial [Striga asiatica]
VATAILGQRLRNLRSTADGGAAAAAMWRMYHERVVDHYENPRNVGSFDKNDPNVGTGLVGAPACGDVMKVQIRVDKETGIIVDVCQKVFGCGSAIASSSVVHCNSLRCSQSRNVRLHLYEDDVHLNNETCYYKYPKEISFDHLRQSRYVDLTVLLNNGRDIAKHLSLPPVKLHCSMLAEDALKAAVKDYIAKRSKSTGSPEATSIGKVADA